MKALTGIVVALIVPLTLLNVFGGLVAAVWLAAIGDWATIGAGVVAVLVSHYVLAILLLPSLLFAAPLAIPALQGCLVVQVFLGLISNTYVLGLITAWCFGVLFFFTDDATRSNLVPRLLWSYGVALGPWQYMAAKEDQDGSSPLATTDVFLAQVAYVALVLVGSFVSIGVGLRVFLAVIAVGLVAQLGMLCAMHKEARAWHDLNARLQEWNSER